MQNIRGPTSSSRAVLVVVVHFILLYKAPMWASALKVKRNWLLLQKVQCKILIRVAAVYKAASTTAFQANTGIPQIDLFAEERRYI